MLASCSRSRRKDVSLTVTSSISRVISCARRRGSATRRRNASGSEPARSRSSAAWRNACWRSREADAALRGSTRAATSSSARVTTAAATGAASAAAGRSRVGPRISSAPRSAAALGIPKTAELASSCAIVSPPARRTSPSPSAPSRPMPVSTTATPSAPALVAMLRSRTSADGRCGPASPRVVERRAGRAPSSDQMRALGRDPDPGRAVGPGAASRTVSGTWSSSQSREAVGEAARDVLHDEDRDREAGRELGEDGGERLRAARGGADADDRGRARGGARRRLPAAG